MVDIPEGFVLESNNKSAEIPPGFELEGVEPKKKEGISTNLFYGSQGSYRGLADVLGAPVDFTNFLLGKAGLPVSEKPFGGSQSIASGMNIGMKAAKEATGLGNPELPAVYKDINEVPELYRPSARFGEVLGSSAPFVAAPIAAARAIPMTTLQAMKTSPQAGILANVVGEAGVAPSQFLRSQFPATIGSAVGAYGAETIAPGSPTAQVVGQLAGGLTGAAISSGTGAIGGAGRRISEPFATQTEAGAQAAAGRALAPILEKSGEAPEAIISRLRQPTLTPELPAGDLAKSPALTGVQEYLMKDNAELANAVAAGRRQAEQGLKTGLQTSFEPGDTGALAKAATQRQATFASKIDEIASTAEKKAMEAAGPVQPNAPGQRTALNTEARDILEGALKKARATESALWNKVPEDITVQPTNTVSAFEKIKGEMLPEDSLPSLVENVMTRFKGSTETKISQVPTGLFDESGAPIMKSVSEAGKPVTVKDIQTLRSSLLEDARSARANNDFKTARRYENIADGALEDLSSAAGEPAKIARDYSRQLNDRFSRTFAGDVLGVKETGASRVRPELTLEQAVTGSPELAAQKLSELRGASGIAGSQMQDVQQKFMRSVSDVIDPTTNRINPAKADRFIQNNGAILEQFPEYRKALESARDSQRAFDDVTKRMNDASKVAEKTAAFSKVLKSGENPSDAVAAALRGAYPVNDIKKLSSLARSSGEEAVGGLRSAVLQHVMDSAAKGDKFSYAKAAEILNSPLSSNGPSLLKSLRDNKIVTASQQAQISAYLDQGLSREASEIAGIKVNVFGSEPGMLGKAGAQIAGAKIGAFLNRQVGGGASVQIPSIGSEMFKKIFAKLPADQAKVAMSRALSSQTPDELISILEKAASSAYGGQKNIPSFARQGIVMLRSALPRSESDTQWEADIMARGGQ
jgi:hypothetical protein